MDKDIIEKLKEKYLDTKFVFKKQEDFLVLLYDNEELEDDDAFFDYVIDLAYEYLDESMKSKLAIEYDDFGEIEECLKSETKEELNFKYMEKSFKYMEEGIRVSPELKESTQFYNNRHKKTFEIIMKTKESSVIDNIKDIVFNVVSDITTSLKSISICDSVVPKHDSNYSWDDKVNKIYM